VNLNSNFDVKDSNLDLDSSPKDLDSNSKDFITDLHNPCTDEWTVGSNSHSGSPILVLMESPYCTVFEILEIIGQIFATDGLGTQLSGNDPVNL